MGMERNTRFFPHRSCAGFVRLFIDSNRTRSSQPQFFIDAMGINDIHIHTQGRGRRRASERKKEKEKHQLNRERSKSPKSNKHTKYALCSMALYKFNKRKMYICYIAMTIFRFYKQRQRTALPFETFYIFKPKAKKKKTEIEKKRLTAQMQMDKYLENRRKREKNQRRSTQQTNKLVKKYKRTHTHG